MQICGLNKTTLLDYPEHVAATIFAGGCNFRCPFCHNGDLVLNSQSVPAVSMEELNSFFKKRTSVLTGVCCSGGEPTLYNDLPALIKNIKDFGYCVKLDTNGSNPQMLADLLAANLLDYIAMDIKSDQAHYALTVGMVDEKGAALPSFCLADIEASMDIIKTSGIPYEFRTTVVRELHNREIFKNMAEWLDGSNAYYLQNYEESEQVLCSGFSSFSKEELEDIVPIFEGHIKTVGIRGV